MTRLVSARADPRAGGRGHPAPGGLSGRAATVPNVDYTTAGEQLRALGSGECSALDLLEASVACEEQTGLNSVVWRDLERARAEAAAVDGPPTEDQPLRGLPMTVKEAFDVANAPTTWGQVALVGNIAAADALVVQRLRAAGAIVWGKSNVSAGLGDYQCENPVYGRTLNPWDRTRTPGGSSGGAAAALAAGITALEIGSDMVGSIRQPAHCCGVFGHKSTWGLIPSLGHAPTPPPTAEPDLAVVGPMARSAADLDLALGVLAHPSPLQAGLRYDLPPAKPDRGLRVALWPDDEQEPVDSIIAERVEAVGAALAADGAVLVDARPEIDTARSHLVFRALHRSFVGGLVPADVWTARKAYIDELGDDHPDIAALRAISMSHHEWLHLNEEREQLRWAWHDFFEDVDVAVMPVDATSAWVYDDRAPDDRRLNINGVERAYWTARFWSGLATVAQLPATVVPTGPDQDGVPIGIQVVGPAYGDRVTIGVARHLEAAGFAFAPPPTV